MVRPRVARGFIDPADNGLSSMYPASDWGVCSGPSWISARVRSRYRTGLDRAIWVTSVRTRSEDRSSISSHPLADLGWKLLIDSSLRDVKQDDSNNKVALSRGGEQIDDVLDGFVGAVVGGFKSAVRAILRVRTAVEAAVGKWSAQPFVEEQKKQRDLNTL